MTRILQYSFFYSTGSLAQNSGSVKIDPPLIHTRVIKNSYYAAILEK